MSLFFKSQLKLQEQNMNYTTPQMKYTNTASALGVNVGIVHYDNETKWTKLYLFLFQYTDITQSKFMIPEEKNSHRR